MGCRQEAGRGRAAYLAECPTQHMRNLVRQASDGGDGLLTGCIRGSDDCRQRVDETGEVTAARSTSARAAGGDITTWFKPPHSNKFGSRRGPPTSEAGSSSNPGQRGLWSTGSGVRRRPGASADVYNTAKNTVRRGKLSPHLKYSFSDAGGRWTSGGGGWGSRWMGVVMAGGKRNAVRY